MGNTVTTIGEESEANGARRELGTAALAHVTPEGRVHALEEHLHEVARRASQFGAAFGAEDDCYLAGLWHDLGKYAGNFQRMIREANGFDAHMEGDTSGPRDHSTAGAIWACQHLGADGLPLAFAIAGHHTGLSDLSALKDRLAAKSERLDSAMRGGAPASVLKPDTTRKSTTPPPRRGNEASFRHTEMMTRFLFSAMCDADRLDTEAFYDAEKARIRESATPLEELERRLTHHMEGMERRARDNEDLGLNPRSAEVNRVRADVRSRCLEAAARPRGAFSLTVPTGGGKTLAGLTFALAHARHHGMERVVVAIPFTSIIEQTADIYREVLGDEAILEHHSAFAPSKETPWSLVAAENWDAPVVVTTTVQLFESLFANRPSACRKLHRLARSVIILDEAQTLPPGLLASVLDGLGTLVRIGASVVISTATQPALGRSERLPEGLERVEEILPKPQAAFERLRRVRVKWPAVLGAALSYDQLAGELAAEPAALAIVHRRDDARILCEAVDRSTGDQSTIHLSALMCAEHRSRALASIKALQKAGRPARVVSTQLVEAGVDLDFPVVYRSLAGLDALAQAAGRCNREGRLPDLGELRVFVAETEPPQGVLRTAAGIARQMLAAEPGLDLFRPETFSTYFRLLYGSKNLDEKDIQSARRDFQFQTVAEKFKMIDDTYTSPLVVPFGAAADAVAALEREGRPSRQAMRRLQRFTVNIPRHLLEGAVNSGFIRLVAGTVAVLDGPYAAAYDDRFGLVLDRLGQMEAGSLVL